MKVDAVVTKPTLKIVRILYMTHFYINLKSDYMPTKFEGFTNFLRLNNSLFKVFHGLLQLNL
jgi:hypothetical protein